MYILEPKKKRVQQIFFFPEPGFLKTIMLVYLSLADNFLEFLADFFLEKKHQYFLLKTRTSLMEFLIISLAFIVTLHLRYLFM